MHARITRFADELAARRVLIACSGGVDSTVLLHSASRCLAQSAVEVVAVHVNHALHADAGDWEQFCQCAAAQFGTAFRALRVDAAARDGRSPEEAARSARYAALKTLVQGGDVLMTAHHRDDQAETVVLQLLRGGGPEGLAGMPACARFGDGHIARPLLDVPRGQIEQYARDHRLEWLDDPANDDLRYDRNYVRHHLAPVLRERWPAWREVLVRAARHQGEACELIERLARHHYLHCRDAGGTLSVRRCMALSDAEKKAVLRYWIKLARLPTPSEKQLLHVVAAMLSGNARSGGVLRWPGAEVGHYRGRLYAMTPPAPLTGASRDALPWPCGTDLELPQIHARLTWRQLTEQAPELGNVPALTVRLRRGGEKCAFAGGRFHKHLKKVFQELGVPPWERDRVPLIYFGDELRVVWNPSAQDRPAGAVSQPGPAPGLADMLY